MTPARSAQEFVVLLRQSVEQYFVDDNYAAFNARNRMIWDEVIAASLGSEVNAILRQDSASSLRKIATGEEEAPHG